MQSITFSSLIPSFCSFILHVTFDLLLFSGSRSKITGRTIQRREGETGNEAKSLTPMNASMTQENEYNILPVN